MSRKRLREFAEDSSTLERLRTILNTKLSDDQIIGGVSLTDRGMQKVAGSLGVAASDLPTLLNSLKTKLKREQGDADDRALAEDDDGRFTLEPDSLGNAVISDNVTGREIMLRGQDASDAREDYERGGSAALASYLGLRESVLYEFAPDADLDRDFNDEIASTARGGTMNFPWRIDGQRGFGTARFDGTGRITRILYAADLMGNEIEPDSHMLAKITKAAQDFVGKE